MLKTMIGRKKRARKNCRRSRKTPDNKEQIKLLEKQKWFIREFRRWLAKRKKQETLKKV